MPRLFLILFSALIYSCASTAASAKRTKLEGTATVPPFKKVMIVFYENQGFSTAAINPVFSKLGDKGALLTNFHAETHPSQPNYIATIAGDTYGIQDDENHDLSAGHIGDLLEAKGKTWKNYAEGYPGGCFTGLKTGRYVRKHTPFISFKNVQANRQRCARIVPATDLAKDIAQGTIPDFSIYTPDMDNDGHDTGIDGASAALQKTIEPLIVNLSFMKDMLLIVTFDEDDRREGNRVYTALIGDSVKPGSKSDAGLNHYSLLKLIEDSWGLGNLGKNDVSATPITGIWK